MLRGSQILKNTIPVDRLQGAYLSNPWGAVRYVQSTHINATDLQNTGKNPESPLRTLAKAIELSIAGDAIILSQGHVETVSTAAGLIVNKMVDIIGLGEQNNRPIVNYTTTTAAAMNITASNVSVTNVAFPCGIDSQVSQIIVTGAACRLLDCELRNTASEQCLNPISVQAADCLIENLKAIIDRAGPVSCIAHTAAGSNLTVRGCWIVGNFSTSVILSSAAATNLLIDRNVLHNANAVAAAACLSMSTSTGIIRDNRLKMTNTLGAAAANAFSAANMAMYENYACNSTGATGILVGAASA